MTLVEFVVSFVFLVEFVGEGFEILDLRLLL